MVNAKLSSASGVENVTTRAGMFLFIIFLSRRFGGKKSKENFLGFMSFFSVLSIAIGVMSLMLIRGVMNGFTHDLKRTIIGANPTIIVGGRPLISGYRDIIKRISSCVPEVKGVSPFLSCQVFYRSPSHAVGGILKGIDLKTESTVTNITGFLRQGDLSAAEKGIILGSELANQLGVKVGDTIQVIGGLMYKTQYFRVSGIVECGVYGYDVTVGLTSLINVQRLFGIGDFVHGIGIRTENIYESDKVAVKVGQSINSIYPVTTWNQKNKILFAALVLEKKSMVVILVLIILMASFNIITTLMIAVFRKTKEIGILRAIGLTPGDIGRIFFYQGLILGGQGLALGLGVGGVLTYWLRSYQSVKPSEFVYNLSRLHVKLLPTDLLLITLTVIVIVSLASIYPAWRASRLNPVEALRHE